MNPNFIQHTAPLAHLLPVENGELAWHDWQRSIKIRKPSDVLVGSGILAFDRSKDAWHKEAFVGTSVAHLIPDNGEPRRIMYDAIDWCGNVIGQIEDNEYGPTGRIFEVQNLGLAAAFYELQRYGLEMMPDGSWVWWLELEYTPRCKHLAQIYHQADRDTRAKPSGTNV